MKLDQPSWRLRFAGTAQFAGTIEIVAIPAYIGPGDVVSGASAWWGLRAYTSASIGGNAVRLREDAGNTEADFMTIAAGGLDLAAITAFKGSANLFVVTLYDQTGGGSDLTQAIQANQPTFTLSGLGSNPIISGTTTRSLFIGPTTLPTASQPNTWSTVARRTSGTGNSSIFGGTGAGGGQLMGSSNANTLFIYAGSTTVTAAGTDNAFHAVQNIFNAGSSIIYVDGSSTSPGNPGTGNFGGASTFLSMFTDQFADTYTGDFCEGGVWSGAFSPTDQSNMDANQHAYWGF